jgi:regulator of protease activity HflC (stomatin/prohibitin superfamily)
MRNTDVDNSVCLSVSRFVEANNILYLIGPGLFFILPCVDTYSKVDLRTVTFDVPPQEILTKDSVTVAVDAVVYFRIFNAVISITNVEDAAKSTKLLAATTLRNVNVLASFEGYKFDYI